MKKIVSLMTMLGCLLLLIPSSGYAKDNSSAMQTDNTQVNTWNQFARRLYILHQYQMTQYDTFQEETTGGYAGNKNFYREIKYYDKKTSHLISRVLWEIEKPEQIHEIEVFVYDDYGNLKRDYLAAFLPEHRNTPVITLINFHFQNDELKSFRQFDASGEKIFERCEGHFFNKPVNISLEDIDFADYSDEGRKIIESEEYLACFNRTSALLGDYVNPLFGIPLPMDLQEKAEIKEMDSANSLESKINKLTQAINKEKSSARLFHERGMAYLKMSMFTEASDDFSQAIKLDDSLDGAYYGRGMAYGRLRMFDESIADLSVYIQRNPRSSIAYTKRGVRRIWAGKYKLAEKDLIKAISLDPKNAEANDDLGVMKARKGNYKEALSHFKKVVDIDPSYSKGFHNLAMAHYILGEFNASLISVNKALDLTPNNKSSLMLKGEILLKLGKRKEAKEILDRAEFLPDGGWQERFSLQQGNP